MKHTTFEDSEKEEKTIERPRLEWQQSTAVSSARASLMPALASSFRNILEDLGEDSSRPGLVDTPDRAAKALLFFTKGYEDRLVDLNTYLHKLTLLILHLYTLIWNGKFEEITILMKKHVILTQTYVISTQWTLKRPKKLSKAKFFFKGQMWRPKAKKFRFNDFFSNLC